MTTAEKLTTIAENQQRVYAAGKTAGQAEGEQSEYDRFWDAYQQNGSRTDYNFAFSGAGWTEQTLKPKYDIVPGKASLMFRGLPLEVNITDYFNEQGIALDFSESISLSEMLLDSKITGVGTVDSRSATYLNYTFTYAEKLQTIRLLILREDGSQTFASAFKNCKALSNITIEGVIGNDIDFGACPLSRDSILSVLDHLSTATSTKTVTFKKTAVEAAFTTDEWEELTRDANGKNWNVATA